MLHRYIQSSYVYSDNIWTTWIWNYKIAFSFKIIGLFLNVKEVYINNDILILCTIIHVVEMRILKIISAKDFSLVFIFTF